jgi:hypothetical protein
VFSAYHANPLPYQLNVHIPNVRHWGSFHTMVNGVVYMTVLQIALQCHAIAIIGDMRKSI